MSHWPPRFETNATDRPSGDNDGCASTPAKFVTGMKRGKGTDSRVTVAGGTELRATYHATVAVSVAVMTAVIMTGIARRHGGRGGAKTRALCRSSPEPTGFS